MAEDSGMAECSCDPALPTQFDCPQHGIEANPDGWDDGWTSEDMPECDGCDLCMFCEPSECPSVRKVAW